jgi:hypothetical protein
MASNGKANGRAAKVELRSSGGMAIIQIAPGQTVDIPVPRGAIPKYAWVRLHQLPDGNYLPVMKHWGQMIRLEKGTPQALGLDCGYRTLLRLIKSGLVRGVRVAPNSWLLDLDSLGRHLEAAADEEFWTEARVRQFREVL